MKKTILLFLSLCIGMFLQAQNNALNFDGTNDYVSCGAINPSAFTLEAWVKPGVVNKDQVIISTLNMTNNTGMELHIWQNGKPVLTVRNGNAWLDVFANTAIPANSWVHLAATYDGTNCKMYINGTDVTTGSSTAVYTAVSNNLSIGCRLNNGLYFNGSIDDARVWNVARSATEITNSMNTPIATPTTKAGLIAYYQFNQGIANSTNSSINILTDASASGLNGVLHNFSLTGGSSNWVTSKPVPTFTSISPISGAIGTTITITGTGFSTTAADNTVLFGAVKATVTASTATSLTLTVPAGAGSIVPVSVRVGGLLAYSTTSTTPSFNVTNTPDLNLTYNISSAVVGRVPNLVAVSDLNIDGIPDLVTANYTDNSVSVLLGTGGGNFGAKTDFTAGTGTYSLALGDFNGDGKTDLVTANSTANSISILLGNGNGGFGTKTDYAVTTAPRSITIGDFNGDGKTDLATANYGNKSVSVFLGDGSGSFGVTTSYTVGTNPISIASGDFNNDGKTDLATANTMDNKVSILLGTGAGSFGAKTDYPVGSSPSTIVIGDFNGDGKADLATANSGTNSISILLGTGTGTFGTKTDYSFGSNHYSLAIGDFNSDLKADLAVSNYDNNSVSILQGTGAGSFSPKIEYPISSNPSSVAVGDFNGDGKADIVSVHSNNAKISIMLCVENPAITTQAATAIGPYSATGNGTITRVGEYTTQYGMVWSTSANPTVALSTKTEMGIPNKTGAFTSAITGLKANTPYFARSYATNSFGTIYGNEVTFKTPIDVPKITSFSPVSGPIGTEVTITGTGFSAVATENTVYFGAVKATVSASTTTSLVLTVPSGAGSVVPVSVMVDKLVAYSATCSTTSFTITNNPNLNLTYTKRIIEVTNPYSFAVGDLNNDGKPDMVTANGTKGSISVMLGNGDGSFGTKTDYTMEAKVYSVKIGDFNGDGKPDLAVTNYDAYDAKPFVSILMGNGDGSFGQLTNYQTMFSPGCVAIGDFNADGKSDLAVANTGFSSVSILIGIGDGTFNSQTYYTVGERPYSIVVGDFNGDSKADLAVSNYSSNSVSILLGSSNGTFGAKTDFPVAQNPVELACGDFNSDGKADLVVANNSFENGKVNVLLGTGTGSFGTITDYPVGHSPTFVAIADFNGDGYSDLLVPSEANDPFVTIFPGNGSGSFGTTTHIDIAASSNSVIPGDFNCDGKTDFLVSNGIGNSVFLMQYTEFPSITTQSVDAISSTYATGHGNITSLGEPAPSAFGVCWNTTGNPTISDSTSNNGAASKTGSFTTQMTGLNANTTYYVKAYATNVSGTVYGDEVSFTTLSQPVITSFSPSSGAVGTTVNITGTGFSPIASNNTVYFGALKATVSSSTSTNITVTVPAGAGSIVPVSVGVEGLFGHSITSSTPIFNITNSPVLTLDYSTISLNTGKKPLAMTVADFNNDSIPDIITANNTDGNISLFLGNKNGNFSSSIDFYVDPILKYITSGDFNGDGNFDLALTNETHCMYVLFGDGHGAFVKTIISDPKNNFEIIESAAFGDFNEDGNADLVIASCTTGTSITILFGTGKGSFGSRKDFEAVDYPYTVAVGDFNNDGHVDVATAGFYSGSVSILPGDGKGNLGTTINSSTGSNPYFITSGDFNHDGIEDLALLCGSNLVNTLTGKGGCKFNSYVSYTVGENPKSLNLGDINGDGNIDLVTPNINDNSISIFKGLGNGSFTAKTDITTGRNPSFVSTGDFNRDGKADIAVANSGANTVSVLLNISVPVTIPNNYSIEGKTISGSEPTCFNAYDTITVAGTSTVTFASGSSVELVAGKSIRFLPGYYAQSGSFMYAHITSDSTFCDDRVASIVENPVSEKSIETNSNVPNITFATTEKSVKLYPNPNNGQFTIELTNVESGATVSIYNILGSVVYQSTATNEATQKVNLSGIKKGIYMVKVIDQKEQLTRKMIVN